MPISADIVCDSVYTPSPDSGPVRLTTFEITHNRFILAEVNTHKVLSKNSASSRAIPVEKQVKKIADEIALPVVWPTEQKGMQGGEPLSEAAQAAAVQEWMTAAQNAINTVLKLRDIPWDKDEAQLEAEGGGGGEVLHKSVVNRLLEPFMWHTAVVTGTAWENFFLQRAHKDAQPEFQAVAKLMLEKYRSNRPVNLNPGEWHLPYVSQEDRDEVWGDLDPSSGEYLDGWTTLAKISAGRCARTSYLTQNGTRDLSEDLTLFGRLIDRTSDEEPRHWSPLEHPATPWPENRQSGSLTFKALNGSYVDSPLGHLPKTGNLLAYRSLRTEYEAMMRQVTYR
jgi:hypothetical protein